MRKGLIGLICLVGFFGLWAGTPVQAEDEPAQLEEIVVTGERIVTPTKQTEQTVYTGSEVTKKGIEIEGSKAEISVYDAIDVLPGISVESVDPYGLAAEQRTIRTRGVRGYLGSMSVEGVPNWGGNPIGPREYIYDTENMRGIAVYKGAVPADLGQGVGARGGAIELRPMWPGESFGAGLAAGFGVNNYYRTFLRVDSGTLPTCTRASVSYSFTDADKWKGPGSLGPRNNTNFMLEQPVWNKDSIKIWFNYNEVDQDLYRALSYTETLDFNRYYRKDYNSSLTGKKGQDIYYYKYNSASLQNTDFFTSIPMTLNDTYRLSFKPYFSLENSNILGGVTSTSGGTIQKRIREINRYGVISEATGDFSFIKAALGYQFEANDMKINTQNYDPLTFAYQGWGNYGENEGNGIINSPYLSLSGKLWNFDWQAGLKYFYYSDPASLGFVWNSKTNSLTRAADLDRTSKVYDDFFPTVGLSYRFLDSLELYGSYGRNFIRPYSYQPLVTLYNANRSTFQKAGVTLNDMFQGFDMETSNNFELGARFRKGWLEINPTGYFSKNSNLLTTVYDPRVKLSYVQNIGKATGYGFEVETNIHVNDNLTFFVNPSYTIMTYDNDLTYQGYVLNAKGNQVVDSPVWLLKTGMIFKYAGFEVVPMLRFVGERYGDVEHKESVDGYFLADLKISYTMKDMFFIKDPKLSLELQNLFNNQYISLINFSDDNRVGSTGYYTGAPFTALGKVSMSF